MEIIAFALALMFTGYVWKPVDRRTLAVSRGSVGALRAGSRAAADTVRVQHRTRPASRGTTTRRRAKGATSAWDDARALGRSARTATRATGRGVRGGYRASRTGYRAARAFGTAARTGYVVAVDRALEADEARRRRKAEKRAEKEARRTPEPGTEPERTSGPTGPETDTEATPGQKETPVTEIITPDVSTEFSSPGDMQASLEELRATAEQIQAAQTALAEGLAAFTSAYEAAGFTTGSLTSAVMSLNETGAGEGVDVAAFLEAAPQVEEAVTEAQSLGEHAASIDAEGDVPAYREN